MKGVVIFLREVDLGREDNWGKGGFGGGQTRCYRANVGDKRFVKDDKKIRKFRNMNVLRIIIEIITIYTRE